MFFSFFSVWSLIGWNKRRFTIWTMLNYGSMLMTDEFWCVYGKWRRILILRKLTNLWCLKLGITFSKYKFRFSCFECEGSNISIQVLIWFSWTVVLKWLEFLIFSKLESLAISVTLFSHMILMFYMSWKISFKILKWSRIYRVELKIELYCYCFIKFD